MNAIEAARNEIADLLARGDVAQAATRIGEALSRWPQSVPLLLLKGEVLGAADGEAAAALHYAGMLDGAPAHPWALARLQKLLGEAHLSPDELLQLAPPLAGSALSDPEKVALLEPLLRQLDPDGQTAFLRLAAPVAGLLRLEWKLAVVETEQGNVEAARDILLNASGEGRSNESARALLAELLAITGRLADGIALLEEAVGQEPDRSDNYRRLISLLQRACSFERAGEVMQAALERWPRDWMLVFRMNRLPVEPERLRSLFRALSKEADSAAQSDERYRYQFALACLHVGAFERAADLLQQPFTNPVARMVETVRQTLAAHPIGFWSQIPRLDEDRTRDVLIARAEDSRMTVVVPTGVSFGYLPTTMLDCLLARHRANVVYLRDFNKRGYLRGVASLGKDEAETLQALKRILADLGADRVVTMGSSLGGFAALRYGAQLGAHAAVSLSGPTDIYSYYRTEKATIWNPSHFQRLILERETDLQCDLRPLIAAGGPTRFVQFYGAESEADEYQAKRLEGLDGVEIIPVPGVADHVVAGQLIADGSFDKLLDRLAS